MYLYVLEGQEERIETGEAGGLEVDDGGQLHAQGIRSLPPLLLGLLLLGEQLFPGLQIADSEVGCLALLLVVGKGSLPGALLVRGVAGGLSPGGRIGPACLFHRRAASFVDEAGARGVEA